MWNFSLDKEFTFPSSSQAMNSLGRLTSGSLIVSVVSHPTCTIFIRIKSDTLPVLVDCRVSVRIGRSTFILVSQNDLCQVIFIACALDLGVGALVFSDQGTIHAWELEEVLTWQVLEALLCHFADVKPRGVLSLAQDHGQMLSIRSLRESLLYYVSYVAPLKLDIIHCQDVSYDPLHSKSLLIPHHWCEEELSCIWPKKGPQACNPSLKHWLCNEWVEVILSEDEAFVLEQERHYVIVSALDNQWEDQVPVGEVKSFDQSNSQLERSHCLSNAKSIHHVCQTIKALAFDS